ncbi:MAG: L-2-hydroxyglutarate oxidase, partial [Gemmatimonadales bacterium]
GAVHSARRIPHSTLALDALVISQVADVLVIGAGAIGASTALHLSRLGLRVTVLEKEPGPARHQSGRNSGVIHAGYNLKPGSLKARFCVEGSRQLRAYCRERGIPMVEGGILILARTEAERGTLAELHRRAQGNGVQSRLVGEAEIGALEPHARGIEGLHAPEGASFDAAAYVRALLAEAMDGGVRVQFNTAMQAITDPSLDGRPAGRGGISVRTTAGVFTAGALVNCGGLHADRLAGSLARDVRIIPFRGYYAELRPARQPLVRSHIYPAPDLTFPFLGVHLSRRTDGRVLVGPGAMLAFGREAYRFAQVHLLDLLGTLAWPGFYRLARTPRFRSLVRSEAMKSLFVKRIWAEARQLVPDLEPGDLVRSFAGNRAQLVSRSGELVDDLVVRETSRAVHVLNAVSPGLTCSLPFGRHLAERCREKLEREGPSRQVPSS